MISQLLFPFIAFLFGAMYWHQSRRLTKQADELRQQGLGEEVAELLSSLATDKLTIATVDAYYVVALVISAVIPGVADSRYWLPIWITLFVIVRSVAFVSTQDGWQLRTSLTWQQRMVKAGQVALSVGAITVVVITVVWLASPRPTFEFLDDTAPVIEEVVIPGDDLQVVLRFRSENEPGRTELSGMFVCEGGFVAEADQYRDFSINVGGGGPFEGEAVWPVPIPENAPRDTACEYRHAATLANGSVQTISATFRTAP